MKLINQSVKNNIKKGIYKIYFIYLRRNNAISIFLWQTQNKLPLRLMKKLELNQKSGKDLESLVTTLNNFQR